MTVRASMMSDLASVHTERYEATTEVASDTAEENTCAHCHQSGFSGHHRLHFLVA